MRQVRIFVSSPSDVRYERARVERVAVRLSDMFDGVQITCYRWEEGRYFAAHETFQKQIPDTGEFDLVVGMVWSRLGMPPPPDFPTMPDGRPYPSGTAYEILTALETRKAGAALPDIFFYRKTEDLRAAAQNSDGLRAAADQVDILRGFIEEWFFSEAEGFKGSFFDFTDTDAFEALFEQHLRDWLNAKGWLGRERRWRIEEKGSPFCGLRAFDAKHEAVFFGRARETARAREVLEDAAGRGCGFLLIDGPSGSGKSSLARAGLVPQMLRPRAGQAERRAAILRPGAADLPSRSLADALFARDALPELTESDFPDPAALAAHLAAGGTIAPILRALDRWGSALQAASNAAEPPATELVLLLDQMEELFAEHVPAEDRTAFTDVLGALARSGRVRVIATLRADAGGAARSERAIVDLINDGETLTLPPPGPAELAEIVRAPAEAAGLVFETDADGRRLDDVLLEEAGGAEALPFVQFTLQQLFEASPKDPDEAAGVGAYATLTFADYRRIGGVEGALQTQAEAALSGIPADQRSAATAALPRLLRGLTEAGPGGVVLTTAARREAAATPAADRLVDALVAARLLIEDASEGDAASLRFAHQRVLSAWDRARTALADSERFLRIRATLTAGEARWRDGGRRRSLLLPSGVPLAEAEEAAKTYPAELAPALRDYIAASRRRARRTQTLTTAAAVLFAGVAVAAGWFFLKAEENARVAASERDKAREALEAATAAANQMIFDLARKFENRGLPLALRRAILDEASALQEKLLAGNPDDADLLRSRAVALTEVGDALFQGGDMDAALEAYEEGLDIFRTLARKDPDNTGWQRDVSVSLDRIGDVRLRAGDAPAALEAYEEGLDIRRTLARKDPDNTGWQRDVSVSLNKIGDVRLRASDAPAALEAYEEGLDIARTLARKDPDNTGWQTDVVVSLWKVSSVLLEDGPGRKPQQATELLHEALEILEPLAAAGKLSANQQTWPDLLRGRLAAIEGETRP